MSQLDLHKTNTTASNPPPQTLSVLEKTKSLYKQWIGIHRNMDRTVRFGLGTKIDVLLLDILEILRKSEYTPIDKKIPMLENAIDRIDSLRFFLQVLWEIHSVSNEQYALLATAVENLGRMVGGWKKGLLKKLGKPGA